MQRRLWIATLLACAFPSLAAVPVDLATLDREMTGPRTQVLVLGSVHLSEVEGGIQPGALDPLLDKLAAYTPDIITVEAISGEQCDLAERHASVYGPDYCASTDVARTATGLQIPAAIEKINAALDTWPKAPTPAQRRQLAAWMLAANERASAYTQWLQLPPAERRAGDGLDATLVALLNTIATRQNENYLIAAQLAARLGLPRVYAIDDHTGDNIQVKDRKAFGTSLEQAWNAGKAELDKNTAIEDTMAKARDLLPLYRFINAPERLNVLTDVNVGATLRATSAEHYPQIWVSGWEIRNLRMVANIQQTFRERPGVRVLSVVGVSHKPWFDQWLGQMQGVDIVDAEQALR
ncbi:DUF5694 domain-containing protein [Stenotrophomonas sp. 22385]|jgi:hypothetical protein|uniref:DUF5694 domain-containing protein n=1 Tax=Stenotrophomonas sp. 22385 TaxID=3453915 RepID=UPI003F85B2E7